MTTLHLRRRLNRRISALGLFLSLGLIFGASGIIRLNAAEHERASADVDHVCGSTAGHQRAESLVVPPVVPFEGRPESEFNL
ncbi:MAG: hypothetical protein F4X15_12530 [Gemmatimonadetes bacterium]|nr:hypothetical protein [Gemmatimonadota bacterium]